MITFYRKYLCIHMPKYIIYIHMALHIFVSIYTYIYGDEIMRKNQVLKCNVSIYLYIYNILFLENFI